MTLPEPTPTPLTAPYWRAAAQGQLVIQRCSECDEHNFPPRAYCAKCEGALAWVACSGNASLVSYAIHGRVSDSEGQPLILALVALEEGVRMATNLVGIKADPEHIELGIPLQVTFQTRGAVRLPVFAPRQQDA